MNKPTVSIIMTTYNNAAYIKEAIDSVLQQTFSDWEFIIINDASTDNTGKIIEEFVKKDKRMILTHNKVNAGQTKNSIKAIEKAQGQFIARLDGDDKWIDKNKLKVQVEFLKKNVDYGLVGAWANLVDEDGQTISSTKYPVTNTEIKNYLLMENCFFHSSIIMRKTIYDKAGGYDVTLQTSEDYNLWLKMGLISKMYNIPEYMIDYRINPNGVNATRYTYQLKETIKVLQNFKNSYPNYTRGIIFWYLRKYMPKNNKKILFLKSIIRKIFFRVTI